MDPYVRMDIGLNIIVVEFVTDIPVKLPVIKISRVAFLAAPNLF
jgi:hypothetical protein